MDRKIRTAIIGMGRMGVTRYQAMKRHGGFQIVALCDNNLTNIINYKETKYQEWKECIDKCKLEAIVVCTFNMIIPDIVCYALQKGIAVFSEKPPGRTLEDALKMEQIQKETGTILKFGFNHRVHNSIIEAKALIDSKLLGDIVCIRGVYGKAGNSHFQDEWRNDIALSGGGILLDQGIHMLDLMCYLTDGDMHVINGEVRNLVWKDIKTEDSALAILETDKKQQISIHSSAIQWRHKFDMDIICTNGYIALNGLLTSTHSYGEERITYYKKDLGMKTGGLGKPKEYTMCFDEDFSWDIEMKEFYDVVIGEKELVNGKPEDAVRVMRIIKKIYEI